LPAALCLLTPDEPEVPVRWDGGHVSLRLTEAFVTLRSLPMKRGAAGFRTSWPPYAYTFQDLLAQAEDGEALAQTMEERNEVRLLPSAKEVSAMEAAIRWGAQYLSDDLGLMRATNGLAFAHALGRDAAWCVRRWGEHIDTWLTRSAKGCERIAACLRRDRVRVW
jgi:hypothetical protein